MPKNIRLYYVGARGINFGDSINPILFERIFGVCVKRGFPTNCDVVGIGSLMQMFTLRHIIKNSKYLYFLKYNYKPVVTMGTGFCCDISKFNFGIQTYREVNPLILRMKLSNHGFDFNVDFKFDDYYSVFWGSRGYINLIGVENIDAGLLSKFMPDKVCENYGISASEVKSCQDSLLAEGQKFFEFI